ncbi:hypothetical protein GCM10023168_16900 [Fodinibacter luteus]|uniref:Uncharacterized protein n=1 Tax=Fodinibacter luteus TaxID=552064 RepID=A0ABP8KDI0_9MICO
MVQGDLLRQVALGGCGAVGGGGGGGGGGGRHAGSVDRDDGPPPSLPRGDLRVRSSGPDRIPELWDGGGAGRSVTLAVCAAH